jgi:hypothetical protein
MMILSFVTLLASAAGETTAGGGFGAMLLFVFVLYVLGKGKRLK